MNNKKVFFIFLMLVFVFVLSGCGSQNSNSGMEAVQDDSSLIFFYGEECPHCKIVEEYFSENKIAEKIQFSQREVYHDKGNATLLAEKANDCGINESELGVPFLWNERTCYVGDSDIIQFFQQKISSENNQ